MDRLAKAFIGLTTAAIPVAIYHAYDEITNYSSPISKACDLNNFISCTNVFNSGYTKFLGVSLYVYGLVWFPLMLALGYWFIRKNGARWGEIMFPVLTVGDLFTLYLWYLEIDKIHAICPVCVSLYAINYVMTVLAIVEVYKS